MQGQIKPKTTPNRYAELDNLIPEEHFLKKVHRVVDLSFIAELTQV